MVRILLLLAILLPGASQAVLNPVVDNDRVTIWDVAGPTAAQPFDAVVVSLSGSAEFVPKGATPRILGRSMVIDLKDHPVPPIANKTGFPLGFPRAGAKKILENTRVIVWDYTWQPGVATPMHFHDKDAVVVFLDAGDLKSTTPDGQATITPHTPGQVSFSKRDRTHTETLTNGKSHAIITELK